MNDHQHNHNFTIPITVQQSETITHFYRGCECGARIRNGAPYQPSHSNV